MFTQINTVGSGQIFVINEVQNIVYVNNKKCVDLFINSPHGWHLHRTTYRSIEELLQNYFSKNEKKLMLVDNNPVFSFEEEFEVGDTVMSIPYGSKYTICMKDNRRHYALFSHTDNVVYDNLNGNLFTSIPDLLNHLLSQGYQKA